MTFILVSDHDGTARRRRESVYTEPRFKDNLSAEILDVARRCESLSTKFQTTDTTATSSFRFSVVLEDFSEQLRQRAPFLQKWDVNEWVQSTRPKSGYQIEFPTCVSSEKISPGRKSSVAELITTLRTSTDLPQGNRLAARLEDLIAISEEEFPEQEPISSRSLEDFLIMIRSVPDIAYPEVVLTCEGNIRAEWTKSRNKHFAVEFLGAGEVRFVVFAPDPVKPYNTNRCSGVSTLDSLMDLVRPYRVFDWIVDPIETAA